MNLTYMLRELTLGLEGTLGLILLVDLIDVGTSIVETTFVWTRKDLISLLRGWCFMPSQK
jgi:hypothetical protein